MCAPNRSEGGRGVGGYGGDSPVHSGSEDLCLSVRRSSFAARHCLWLGTRNWVAVRLSGTYLQLADSPSPTHDTRLTPLLFLGTGNALHFPDPQPTTHHPRLYASAFPATPPAPQTWAHPRSHPRNTQYRSQNPVEGQPPLATDYFPSDTVNVNVPPFPISLSTHIFPPISSTNSFDIASPSPDPCCLSPSSRT